jgi:hypothetical protein
MLRPNNETWCIQEKLISEAIRDAASEFRLIELTDLVSYFRLDLMGPVEALINSALELYFKPGSLAFLRSGSAHVNWNGSFLVKLDFEFRHGGLCIFFTILLRAASAAIQIKYVSVDGRSSTHPDAGVIERTATALSAVRLRPVENQLAWWRHSALTNPSISRQSEPANFLT